LNIADVQGSGKLLGKQVLITGGDSGMWVQGQQDSTARTPSLVLFHGP
jgi:hypothetical protein